MKTVCHRKYSKNNAKSQFAMFAAAMAFGGVIVTGAGIFSRIGLMWKLFVVMTSLLFKTEVDSFIGVITEPSALIIIAIVGSLYGLSIALRNSLPDPDNHGNLPTIN